MKQKIALRKKAKLLEPILRIGKNGVTENLINEVNELLKKRKLIKIKFLRASMKSNNKEGLINRIIEKTDSDLIETVGNIAVIYKR